MDYAETSLIPKVYLLRMQQKLLDLETLDVRCRLRTDNDSLADDEYMSAVYGATMLAFRVGKPLGEVQTELCVLNDKLAIHVWMPLLGNLTLYQRSAEVTPRTIIPTPSVSARPHLMKSLT